MLDVLVRRHPHRMTREELAAAVDVDVGGGTFAKYLSILRSNGLAETTGGELVASGSLFLAGAA
jgi:hypothetical protein